jgi:CheY-like chemotaxis protein
LKTRPRAADRLLTVNLVGADAQLAERARQFSRKNPRFSFRLSTQPLAGGEFDAFVVPAARLPPGELLAALKAGGGTVLAYGPPERLRSAFLAGCDDYLRQPWSFEELECRLEHAGGAPGAQAVQEVAPGVSLRGFSLEGPSGKAELSYPESRVLQALLRHRSQALSREVLAYAIWGRRAEPGSRAVDAHVSGLRRKLRRLAPPGSAPIRSLRGVGYSLD